VAFLDRCEAVTTTLDLSRLKVQPLGPNRAYVVAVNANIRQLNDRRRAARARLATARSGEAKAREAEALAQTFADAADAQSRLARDDDPRANRELVRILRAARDAYTGLAGRARAGDAEGYRTAAAVVAGRERALEAALGRLRRANGASGG